jgi:hypothetical protein
MPRLEERVPGAARAAVDRAPLVPIPPLDAREIDRR